MSTATATGPDGEDWAHRTLFERAESNFLRLKSATERDFYSRLAKLRADLPPEGQADLDEAERVFRAEHEIATQVFYSEHEEARKLEASFRRFPPGENGGSPA